MHSGSRLLLLAIVALSTACASAPTRTRSTDRNRVAVAELAAATEANLYDFLSAHRPRWLQPRGTAAISQRGAPTTGVRSGVVVYVNDSRMGGLEILRTMSRDGVREMRFYDLTEAQQRFPNRETTPVIQIITQ